MSKLTKKEKEWLIELQEHLNKCPSKRIGFCTIGDSSVFIFDASKIQAIYDIQDAKNVDFMPAVDRADANFDTSIFFPNAVVGACG